MRTLTGLFNVNPDARYPTYTLCCKMSASSARIGGNLLHRYEQLRTGRQLNPDGRAPVDFTVQRDLSTQAFHLRFDHK